jgi:hypothetical protein
VIVVAVSTNKLVWLIFECRIEQTDFGMQSGSCILVEKDKMDMGPECRFCAAVIVESVDGDSKFVSDGSDTTSVDTASLRIFLTGDVLHKDNSLLNLEFVIFEREDNLIMFNLNVVCNFPS